MEGFCRGCLIKYDEPMELLQYTEKNRRLFVYSTGLQVKRNDTFTFQLCKDCYLNMKQASKFKKLCRTSDKRFRNYVALKDIGDTVDFCTFLKNNDDTMTFRLPMASGNSTPANQKCRDEDNESTCTSIRNFMTDMLQGEEMPDSEARIIREVIEEEADVLDDTLDSHWLQEDMSIDTDFRLDFSPFSTPRNDHCYTPRRLEVQKEDLLNLDTADHDKTHKVVNDFTNAFKNDHSTKELLDFSIDEIDGIGKSKSSLDLPILDDVDKVNINVQNVCISNKDIVPVDPKNAVLDDKVNIDRLEKDEPCTIDKNLEEALKNKENKEFSLDDLLVSPPVFKSAAALTPTITDILFGENHDLTAKIINPKLGQCIETFQDMESDIEIFEEFFQNDTKEFNLEDIKKVNGEINVGDSQEAIDLDKIEVDSGKKLLNIDISMTEKDTDNNDVDTSNTKEEQDYDIDIFLQEEEEDVNKDEDKPKLDNNKLIIKVTETFNIFQEPSTDSKSFKCYLCHKKFQSSKALCIHYNKAHQIKIVKPKTANKPHKKKLCNICGKEFRDSANFNRHLKNCQNPAQVFKCERCLIELTSQAKFDRHMSSHLKNFVKKDTGKEYVCSICGHIVNRIGNYRLHMRRHTKSYITHCEECGKGFYRSVDLNVHMRSHTGERPYSCSFCTMRFARKDVLSKHLKHHTDERYECKHCGAKFVENCELTNHLKKSIRCLKKRGINDFVKKNNVNSDTQKEEVAVICMEDTDKTIRNELPILETELSN